MARHNYVNIVGQVCTAPRISDGGRSAMVSVNVINGVRDTFDNTDELTFDTPTIYTFEHDVIADIIASLHLYDIIEVKGKFTVLDIPKAVACPSCREKKVHRGNACYIRPDHIGILATGFGDDKNKSFAELRKRVEISNQVFLIGRLCGLPKPDINSTNIEDTKSMQYTIAVNRKEVVKEDNSESKADYIHIKSFGKIAKSDRKFLTDKSLVFIDGMIQTRSTLREEICEKCNTRFKWKDSTMIAVPYSVEYLRDFNIFEEDDDDVIESKDQTIANSKQDES